MTGKQETRAFDPMLIARRFENSACRCCVVLSDLQRSASAGCVEDALADGSTCDAMRSVTHMTLWFRIPLLKCNMADITSQSPDYVAMQMLIPMNPGLSL